MGQLSRRDFGLFAAAASLAPAGGRADEPAGPVIIAEGGAAEERIEDTRSAFDLAINQGCDFIQADLAPSKDGGFVARRDNEISATTDIASRPAFADRKATKTIGGQPVEGWFSEDFTLAELTGLGCREPLPAMRPQNVKLNGKEPVLSLAQVLQIARYGCIRTGRIVGVCLRMRRVKYFNDLGVSIVERLAAALSAEGYISAAAAIWAQADDADALAAFGRASPLRRMLVIESNAAPEGAPPDLTAAVTTTRDGLARLRGVAEAIAPDQDLLFDLAAALFPAPTTLALDAHDAGLQVFSRTARIENGFLPPKLRRGDPKSKGFAGAHGDADRLMLSLFLNGVDGVCTNLPAAAVQDRAAAIAAIRKRKGKPTAG